MVFSIIYDDTSLLLTLGIILLLSFSIYVGKGYRPLVHPLILSRQSDVSQIRHRGQSAVYRNSNTPAGLDLASKPRKKISGVADVLRFGSEGSQWSYTKKRSFYGLHRSNADIFERAERFGRGIAAIANLSSSKEVGVAVCVETDTIKSLEVTISGSVQSGSGEVFYPMVISPEHVRAGEIPASLPMVCSAKRLHAVFTSVHARESALQLPGVDKETLVVVSTREEAESIRSSIPNRVILFDEVLEHSSERKTEEARAASEAIHSIYWTGVKGWVEVTNSSLIAAITAHLAFFSADAQLGAADHIYVAATFSEEGITPDSSSASLVASRHPAGLVYPLLALYAGATFTSSQSRSHNSMELYESQPTVIYATQTSASHLASALGNVSKKYLFSQPAKRGKLAFLRHGTFTSNSLWDKAVFAKVRHTLGCEQLRSVIIVGNGGSVSQQLLDTLRVHLSCSVRQVYLPTTACSVLGSELTAGVESATSEETTSPSSAALFTAPVTATHSLDLQAFTVDGQLATPHVGPPNVGVEVKLVETPQSRRLGYIVDGKGAEKTADPCGEIFVRGHSIAGTSGPKEWLATGDFGCFRSNGTLVLLSDSKQARSSERNDKKGASLARSSQLLSVVHIFVCIMLCVCHVEAGVMESRLVSPTSSSNLHKRAASSPVNSTLVETAMMGFLTSPRAAWEQGSAQSSILEYSSGDWSIFSAENGQGPPYLPQSLRAADASGFSNQLLSMTYSSVETQDSVGKLCTQVTGDETADEGSALDPASCGEAVLIAAFRAGEIANGTVANPNGMWASAAQAQLSYLLNEVPKGTQGALSMRSTGLAYWSDGIYMAPPFLALYGLMTSNQSLLQEGYNQINYYVQALRIGSGDAEGLLRHIVNGTVTGGRTTDNGAWLTGNGWALAGMVKVIAIISQSEYASEMQDQISNLIGWSQDILDGCYKYADPLIRNYVNDSSTFYDAAGSALVAYATYRLASLSPTNHSQYIEAADAIYDAVQDKLTPYATFTADVSVVNALTFTSTAQRTPESLAFLVLLSSAKRDHQQGNVTGLNGPTTGYKGGSTALLHHLHGSTAWTLLGSALTAMLALTLI